MQKKLIALAIAGLASTAAFAQSNVQIYGAIDMGYSWRGDSANGSRSQNAIDSGISDGNRLGFKGTEDLGNGLKAVFTLESGFLADTGVYDGFAGGGLYTRLAYVGLASDSYGTVIAGRLQTPQYSFLTSIDPFGEGTVGTYLNVAGNDQGSMLAVVPRVSNAVAYVSPSFSGLNVTAAYSSNALAQDAAGNSNANNRVYAVLPRYTNGPLDIGLSYHVIDLAGPGSLDIRNWALGGTYDFGAVKLHAFYAKTKEETAGSDLDIKNWMLGLSAPFGRHTVKASYNFSDADQGGDLGDSRQWALGYNYTLSKRTSLYAAYADIKNEKARASFSHDASNDASAGQYQKGFNVGVMHTF